MQDTPENYEKILNAIPGSFGNRAEIARRVKLTWRTVKAYFEKFPELQKLLEDENEQFLDLAEQSLVRLIEEGNFQAVKFALSTHGKGRGYSTRTEVTGANGGPVAIRYINDWRGPGEAEVADADSDGKG